jgi:hypothetical protein
MVRCLSTLMRFERLSLGFESPLPRPVRGGRRMHPPGPTRSVLPVLRNFRSIGINEYVEDLVVDIDAPLLDGLYNFSSSYTRHPTTRPVHRSHTQTPNTVTPVTCSAPERPFGTLRNSQGRDTPLLGYYRSTAIRLSASSSLLSNLFAAFLPTLKPCQ